MNLQSKFGYSMTTQTVNIAFYFVSETELRICRQTARRKIWLLDAPADFLPGDGSMLNIHILYSDCNLALMQALMILYLITRYDNAVIIFILFMFFDHHYIERTWYLHFQIGSFG